MAQMMKTGEEVLSEVNEIIVNMEGLIDALCLIDNAFSLDNCTLNQCEQLYLIANHSTILNIHNLVEISLHEIIEKIDSIKLQKEAQTQSNPESAN